MNRYKDPHFEEAIQASRYPEPDLDAEADASLDWIASVVDGYKQIVIHEAHTVEDTEASWTALYEADRAIAELRAIIGKVKGEPR